MMAPLTSAPYGIQPPEFRLAEDTRLGGVRLQIGSLPRSLEFYEGVLGLRVVSRTDGEARLAAHDQDRVLVVLVERPGIARVPRGGALGLFHFAILLPDRESLARFVRRLSEIGAYAGMSDHAVSEAVYLTDPDGLGIEVYADRPRAEWAHRNRQLLMTTEPLNVRALLAAAGDRPWSGMPKGTSIGHVHLHVGNLAEAAAFYHSALGFDKVVWDYPGALFLSAGGYHHHLGTNTWSSGPPATDGHARLLSWDIVVPRPEDAAAAARSLARAGYSVTADDARRTWRAPDPWGTTLRMTSDPEENDR
jgi:catechol 2,3-dioxygenase